MDFKRGDIVTVNLNPKKGHEVGKIRPALIISGDDENLMLDTIIILPLSTSLVNDMLPYRFRLEKRDNLNKDSDVLLNQVRTLSKQRIGEKIAEVTAKEYKEIINNLCLNFI